MNGLGMAVGTSGVWYPWMGFGFEGARLPGSGYDFPRHVVGAAVGGDTAIPRSGSQPNARVFGSSPGVAWYPWMGFPGSMLSGPLGPDRQAIPSMQSVTPSIAPGWTPPFGALHGVPAVLPASPANQLASPTGTWIGAPWRFGP